MCFDAELPTGFYHEDLVKARKQHTCCECRRLISVGDTYQRVTGKWSFGIATEKTCLNCVALRERVAVFEMEAGCRGAEAYPPFGGLLEAVREMAEEGDVLP